MSYMELVGVTIDTGGLEEALGTLTEKVKELENGKDIDALVESAVSDALDSVLEERIDNDLAQRGLPDEDRVHDLIATYIGNENLMDSDDVDRAIDDKLDDVVDEDKVRDIFRDLAHSEGEDFVRGVVDNLGYVTEDDVDEKIKDALENGNFASDSTVESLGERVDDLENDIPDTDTIVERVLSELPDNEDVTRLEGRVAELERRFELYATRVDEQGQTVSALNERLDIMAERLGDNTVTNALTLLDLLKRAAQILGIGGRA
jgi:uncharacterized coiled-coil protein SlyX/polyhydroxyalkanoate synthesis regulator phasin